MNSRNFLASSVTGAACVLLVAWLLSPAEAQQCSVGKYRAEYFKGEKRVFARCENRIRYDWGNGGPRAGGDDDGKSDSPGELAVGTDQFRVTWTGRFNFQNGNYTFIAVADDGVRVTVDSEQLIDEWRVQAATEFRASKRMTAGTHTVKVEYFENIENASINVRWERSGR